ncbi:hypothetical protein A1F99_093630 [Pyrenophora tritici-repentis]|nr:hypothetical protein A1F99_093630 [Pyrenophora tritici-repentis]
MEVAPSVEVMPSMAVMPRLEGRSRDCAAQAYPLCPAFNVVLPLLLVLLLAIVTRRLQEIAIPMSVYSVKSSATDAMLRRCNHHG